MSIPLKSSESDLYGDIYSKEEVKVEEQDEPVPQAAGSGLPAKPEPGEPTALSYSAQVARQFSEYQQPPGQEATHPAQPVPSTSAIATHVSNVVDQHQSGEAVRRLKPSEMRDEGKMFIGGLNWDTTDDGLTEYLSQFGKVDACTIMRDPDGRSRGFAFMAFEDASSVAAVLSQKHQLDGKSIDPKRAIPREEHLRNARYFVGGLAPATTGETMRAFFATWGKVVDTKVMVDRESGRSKGFGFVIFEDGGDTDQLIGRPGLMLDDKQIEVKAAQTKTTRDSARTTNPTTITTTPYASPSFPVTFNGGNMSMGTPFVSPNLGAGATSFFGNPMMNPMMMAAMYQRMAGAQSMGAQGMGGGGGMVNPMAMMGMMNMMNMGGMGQAMGGGMGFGTGLGMGGNPPVRLGSVPPSTAQDQTPQAQITRLFNTSAARSGTGVGTGTSGAAANGNGNVNANAQAGPVRTSRGGHGYHPYAR